MSNRHLVAVHEKIMTCSNIYSVAHARILARTAFFDALRRARCVLLRRSVETEMHLAARILLPFGLPEKKVETTAQSHTHLFGLLSVYASLYICICLRAAADTAAVSGCLDDPSTSSSSSPTNTLNCRRYC